MNSKIHHSRLEYLLKQTRKGNELSFSKIIVATLDTQYFLASHMLHDSNLAMAVVEETYVAFYKSLYGIEHSRAVIAYLSRVNYNFGLKIRNRNYDDLEARFTTYNKQTTNTSTTREDAFSKLPHLLRSVLILRYGTELSIQDTAFTMGSSPKTITRYLKKAIKLLNTTPHHFKITLEESIKQESIPTYNALQNILKATDQPSVSFDGEILELLTYKKPLKSVYLAGGGGVCIIIIIFLIAFSHPQPQNTPDNTPTPDVTPSDEQQKITTDLVPPSIKNLKFSDDNTQVSFTIYDDIGVDTSRISILEGRTESIAYKLSKDSQISFSMPDAPVTVYLYDLDGNETRQTIKKPY
jgi:RNA polymerase sigma factor (sigma-70 family)